MKVNSNFKNDISFNGFWNSKFVKKGLEFASENGALFAAGTTLALSAGVRPLAILATPKTDKENKKIACAKSIASGLLEFGITLAISLPISNAFKKIDANPTKYLKKSSVLNLSDSYKNIKESKAYSLATQLFKLGLSFAVVIPKAILTALGIPIILDRIFNFKTSNADNANNNLIFKGKGNESLAKGLGKILDNKHLQDFATKNKNSNFPLHIFTLKDIFATSIFISQANKNKQINNQQKPFLIKDSIISTSLSIISSYTIDKLTDKKAEQIIKKIKSQNSEDPKLAKYLEGFRITKPIVILALVYYTIIPIISTFLAQISENIKKEA